MASTSLVQPYIDLGIVTDADSLADEATQYLADNIDGWEPNEGNLEVRLISAISQMAAAIADAAGNVPLDIFINYGQQFFGIAMNTGSYAQATVEFTAQDANGYTIDSGTDLTIGGLGFQTTADIDILAGVTTATATVQAVDVGSAYNGMASNPQVESAQAALFVTGVTVTEPSAGGSDPETATDYANRLATYLLLQTPRPVTASGFAIFALTADIPVDPPVSGSYIGVGRATAQNAFNPTATQAFTGTLASGTNQITSASTTTNMGIGTAISGTGIPSGTYVLGISGSTITISNEATASGSESLTATGLFNQASWITLIVTDESGDAFTTDELAQIETYIGGGTSAAGVYYDGFVMAMTNLAVLNATYNDITIGYTAYITPGEDPTATQAAIQAQLQAQLNPLTWGAPTTGDPSSSGTSGLNWQNYNTLRLNKVIRWIEDVQGVDYCPIGSVTINGQNADLVMDGLAPLPQLTTVTGTVTTETLS